MAVNVFANRPVAVTAIKTVNFADIGLSDYNILVIHRIDNPPASWIPTRSINPINKFEKGKGYNIYAKIDLDLSEWVVPPLDDINTIKNWVQANFSELQHLHDIGDIEGLQAALNAKQDYLTAGVGIKIENNVISVTNPTVDWSSIQNKPTTFNPSAHTHAISEITGLQGALDGKANTFTASNGLTLSGNVLKLGGNLNAATTINGSNFGFNLNNIGSFSASSGTGFSYPTYRIYGDNSSVFMISQAGSKDAASFELLNGNEAYMMARSTYSNSKIVVRPDSIDISPSSQSTPVYWRSMQPGDIFSDKVMVWSSMNERVGYMDLNSLPTAYHTHATSDITSGVFVPARLGTGTADATKVLYGDGQWKTISTYTASNGLKVVGNTIELGGVLTKSSTIDGGLKMFEINNTESITLATMPLRPYDTARYKIDTYDDGGSDFAYMAETYLQRQTSPWSILSRQNNYINGDGYAAYSANIQGINSGLWVDSSFRMNPYAFEFVYSTLNSSTYAYVSNLSFMMDENGYSFKNLKAGSASDMILVASPYAGDSSRKVLKTISASSFALTTHSHAISDIINLQVELNSKAAANHTHDWNSITSKPTSFTPSAHTHDASDITSGVFTASRLGNSVGTEGDVLMIKNGIPKWWQAADTVPTHAHRIVDLTDFNVANPQGGQLFRYDNGSMSWTNWTPNFLNVAGFPAAGYVPVFNADGFTYWQPQSGGGLSGSGFNGSLARWNSGSLTDSIFYSNGSFAGIGTGTFFSSATLTIKATQTYGMYMQDSGGSGIAFITNYGAAAFANDITGFYSFSDARLKNSIRPLDQKEVAEKLLQLNPVHFKWNDRKEAGDQVGFIAQEVEQIFPELVRETERFDGMKYKIVDYEKATALLLAGYKELVERVKQLENK